KRSRISARVSPTSFGAARFGQVVLCRTNRCSASEERPAVFLTTGGDRWRMLLQFRLSRGQGILQCIMICAATGGAVSTRRLKDDKRIPLTISARTHAYSGGLIWPYRVVFRLRSDRLGRL